MRSPGTAETDEQSAVHLLHGGKGQRADAIFQPALIQRADLLEQNDRILLQSVAAARDFDVRGKFRLRHFARDRRRDDRGGIFIADVVLHDEHGAYAALLAPDNGA